MHKWSSPSNVIQEHALVWLDSKLLTCQLEYPRVRLVDAHHSRLQAVQMNRQLQYLYDDIHYISQWLQRISLGVGVPVVGDHSDLQDLIVVQYVNRTL